MVNRDLPLALRILGWLRSARFSRMETSRRWYPSFEPVAFGISPSPENEPDVEYLWRSDPYIKR